MRKPGKKKEAKPNTPLTAEFQCPICGETFDTKEELTFHERTHRGEQVGAPGTSDRAPEENAGMMAGEDDKSLPFAGPNRKWTTGTGDREEGEITGRQTPGGRNAGFSGDAGLDMDKE